MNKDLLVEALIRLMILAPVHSRLLSALANLADAVAKSGSS